MGRLSLASLTTLRSARSPPQVQPAICRVVLAVLAGVAPRGQTGVDHPLAQHARLGCPARRTRSMTSMTRWKRSRSLSITMSNGVVVVPLLLEAAHVDVGVIGAAVGEPVDQPGIAVVGEDDRPVAW